MPGLFGRRKTSLTVRPQSRGHPCRNERRLTMKIAIEIPDWLACDIARSTGEEDLTEGTIERALFMHYQPLFDPANRPRVYPDEPL